MVGPVKQDFLFSWPNCNSCDSGLVSQNDFFSAYQWSCMCTHCKLECPLISPPPPGTNNNWIFTHRAWGTLWLLFVPKGTLLVTKVYDIIENRGVFQLKYENFVKWLATGCDFQCPGTHANPNNYIWKGILGPGWTWPCLVNVRVPPPPKKREKIYIYEKKKMKRKWCLWSCAVDRWLTPLLINSFFLWLELCLLIRPSAKIFFYKFKHCCYEWDKEKNPSKISHPYFASNHPRIWYDEMNNYQL